MQMQGTSTKLTAGALSSWIIICLSYAVFSAAWGPQWTEPPAEVVVAFTGLVGAAAAWLVPEKAVMVPVKPAVVIPE